MNIRAGCALQNIYLRASRLGAGQVWLLTVASVRVRLPRTHIVTMDATFWNDRYAGAGYVYGQAPNAFVTEMARHIPAGPVLCLAEGEGRNAAHLATLGHSVTAVDLSEVGLTKARQLAAVRGVEIQTLVANLGDYRIVPGVWAGIIATFAHLPPTLRRGVHAAAAQGLQAGGVFILEAYTLAQLAFGAGGPKAPDDARRAPGRTGGPGVFGGPRSGTRHFGRRKPHGPQRGRPSRRPPPCVTA